MIETPFKKFKEGFENNLIESTYKNNKRIAIFGTYDDDTPGIIWNTDLEKYFSENDNGKTMPQVAKYISEVAKMHTYGFAMDGLVSKINKDKIDLGGRSGKELSLYLEDSLNIPDEGDMIRVFATPINEKFLSAGAFTFYLRNYSVENGVYGLNKENFTFREELIRTKYPGLDDKLIYPDREDTLRESTKRLIDTLRETKTRNLKTIHQPTFRFDHTTLTPDVEDAAHEGLVKMDYTPNLLSDTRNYAMRLASLEDKSPLRHIIQRGGSLEEVFIPEGENKFRVQSKSAKGKKAIKRVKMLNGSLQSHSVSKEKLGKFFYMCKEAREGNATPEDIIKMLN